MNFDQAKALRLQQWRSALDNQEFRMQNPEVHRQTLHSMSEALAAEGLVDRLQQYDMDEMANAAYWHAVEELLTSPPRYCGASYYDVVQRGTADLRGRIGRSIFYEAKSLAVPNSGYDGKIYPDASGANLVFSNTGAIARITELTLIMPDGQIYDLVETQRFIEGIPHQPIEDPDMYRVLVDSAQIARENRNLRAFGKARPLLDLAKFCICPTCFDRFGQREECPTCIGKGFVTKPVRTGLR
ncbi:hypothetical protein ACQR3P_18610 [Rhodococcus sp. IEGM1300]